MTLLDTIAIVLERSGKPLHATEITRRLLTQRRWSTNSSTPQISVRTSLARDLRVRRDRSRFQRTGAGVFALRTWGLPEPPAGPATRSLPVRRRPVENVTP
jgi:restriction system protein